jgi:hypothetical protein
MSPRAATTTRAARVARGRVRRHVGHSPTFFDTFGLAASTLRAINPHFKYIDLSRRGYMLVDADATRVVSEWWYVDTVARRAAATPSAPRFRSRTAPAT